MTGNKAGDVLVALRLAQLAVIRAQQALLKVNPLAVQIPMYGRMQVLVTTLQQMILDAGRLPL